jgi:hypothetical protein
LSHYNFVVEVYYVILTLLMSIFLGIILTFHQQLCSKKKDNIAISFRECACSITGLYISLTFIIKNQGMILEDTSIKDN